ncbi:hypothetical protein EVAR_12542_1 [Eumeta japonica]|uniref:Uncharacterized protein n=1 Tax=Eumeta variegata TaxID=151549 RepID=A0A4C1TPQ3_EUMVA|nr:hypothetical protein EVAR_12542_1 [Eumeta japonica]
MPSQSTAQRASKSRVDSRKNKARPGKRGAEAEETRFAKDCWQKLDATSQGQVRSDKTPSALSLRSGALLTASQIYARRAYTKKKTVLKLFVKWVKALLHLAATSLRDASSAARAIKATRVFAGKRPRGTSRLNLWETGGEIGHCKILRFNVFYGVSVNSLAVTPLSYRMIDPTCELRLRCRIHVVVHFLYPVAFVVLLA